MGGKTFTPNKKLYLITQTHVPRERVTTQLQQDGGAPPVFYTSAPEFALLLLLLQLLSLHPC